MKKVRSWSHTSWVTNHEKLVKKVFAVYPKTALGQKKRKKIMAIVKLLRHAKAKRKNKCIRKRKKEKQMHLA